MKQRLSAAGIAALFLFPFVAHAQANAGATTPHPDVTPFDIPYGAPMTLETAQRALGAAVAMAQKRHWKEAVAVVGPSGGLIAFSLMDGTQYASIDVAQAKARTAAIFRRPSKAFEASVNSGGMPGMLSLMALTESAASEGGIPITQDGKLVGAIGASGGTPEQDGIIAKAGMDALASRP